MPVSLGGSLLPYFHVYNPQKTENSEVKLRWELHANSRVNLASQHCFTVMQRRRLHGNKRRYFLFIFLFVVVSADCTQGWVIHKKIRYTSALSFSTSLRFLQAPSPPRHLFFIKYMRTMQAQIVEPVGISCFSATRSYLRLWCQKCTKQSEISWSRRIVMRD